MSKRVSALYYMAY